MTNVRTLPVGEGNEELALALDELAREGARRMIAAALRAEADEYVERFSDELDEDGHRLVVRNGRARERKVTIGSGTIPVRAPRVNDKRVNEENGGRQRFSSRILPACQRRRSAGVKFRDGIKVSHDDTNDDNEMTPERVAA
jgi:putative transposase